VPVLAEAAARRQIIKTFFFLMAPTDISGRVAFWRGDVFWPRLAGSGKVADSVHMKDNPGRVREKLEYVLRLNCGGGTRRQVMGGQAFFAAAPLQGGPDVLACEKASMGGGCSVGKRQGVCRMGIVPGCSGGSSLGHDRP